MSAKKDDKKKKNRLQGGGAKKTVKEPAATKSATGSGVWSEHKPDTSKEEAYGAKLKELGLSTEMKDAPQGLCLIPDFISKSEEQALLDFFNGQNWDENTSLDRRTQQWGYAFDYKEMSVVSRAAELPPILDAIIDRMMQIKEVDAGNTGFVIQNKFPYTPSRPHQLIVNEYRHSKGIHPHVDRSCFGECVASLSLGASCKFVLQRVEDCHVSALHSDLAVPKYVEAHVSQTGINIDMPPRALILLKGDARHDWTHGIPPRHSHGVRVSLTFRTMKPEALERVGIAKTDVTKFWGGNATVQKPPPPAGKKGNEP
ncbi:hypothetical protein DIPPA_34580 [Diplonema papillatum]|nr:hypothetical protein DIPPA_34580 [Diplonema papillatum]|eukprot:gene6332-9700_t